jgi:hypothetical protein
MIKPTLDDFMKQAVDYCYTEPQQYYFRGSSLPYCAVRDALHQCQSSIKAQPVRRTQLKQQYTMDIGTLVHKHIQRILGAQGRLFGKWECQVCGAKTTEPSVGPFACCGRPCDYVELRVSHPSGFGGTVDALIPYKEGFILGDFKTKEKKKFPDIPFNKNYRSQVFAYKYVLSRPPYNYPILGQALIYIARDDISKFEIQEMENDDFADSEFEFYVKQKATVEPALQTGNMDALIGYCSTPSDDQYCPYSSICFSSGKSINLRKEWERSVYNASSHPKS